MSGPWKNGALPSNATPCHSVENCPARPVRLAFDSDIQLTAPEITIRDERLRLDAHFRSEDELLLASYSLAVHVFDQREACASPRATLA